MFTGLIEEIGRISGITQIHGGRRLRISAEKIFDDLKVDDSVSVNGICLTVAKLEKRDFFCDAVGATLTKTNLQNYSVGDEVNLERAVRLSDRLGGHLVQGHVNGVGIVNRVVKLGDNYYVEITVDQELKKFLVGEGSIAIDGISLTIAKLDETAIGISIIPHTWNYTTIKNKKPGDKVNIETDIIAKYVEKFLSNSSKLDDKFTDSWFKNLGYQIEKQ